MVENEVVEALCRIEKKLDELIEISRSADYGATSANSNSGEALLKIDDVFFLVRDQLLPIFEEEDDEDE